MTPKQKAIDLLDDYRGLVPEHFGGMEFELAKKCALICVNELILNCAFYDHERKKEFMECKDFPDIYFSEYWRKIEQEIEKL